MGLNERLKKFRKELNLSQEYVAKVLNLTRTAITAIECGNRKVSAEELNTFSNLYGVPADQLLKNEVKFDDNVKMFARTFSELSSSDKEEILNLMNFKRKFKDEVCNVSK